MEVSGTVYSITNILNNKIYIGSTTKPVKRRWDLHRSMLNRGCHHNIHLQRAWDKYGQDNFELNILEQLDNSQELLEHEQTWLDLCRADGDVYNIALHVTSTTLGTKRTKEHREYLSKIRTGIPCPSKGHVWTDEERQRCSERSRGKSNPHYGKHHSEISKEKMRVVAAKPYPTFISKVTGEMIPAGTNLKCACERLELSYMGMWQVKAGIIKNHCGWVLYEAGS